MIKALRRMSNTLDSQGLKALYRSQALPLPMRRFIIVHSHYILKNQNESFRLIQGNISFRKFLRNATILHKAQIYEVPQLTQSF